MAKRLRVDTPPRSRKRRCKGEGPLAGLFAEIWGEIAGNLSIVDQALRLGLVSRRCCAATRPFKGTKVSLSYTLWWNLCCQPAILTERFAVNVYTTLEGLGTAFDPILDWILSSQARIRDVSLSYDGRKSMPFLLLLARLDRLTIVDPQIDNWRGIVAPTLGELVLLTAHQRSLNRFDFGEVFPGLESLTIKNATHLVPWDLWRLRKLKHLKIRIARRWSDEHDSIPCLPELETLRIWQDEAPSLSPVEICARLPSELPKLQTLDWCVKGHWRIARTGGGPIEGSLFFDEPEETL
jgi:hypothetical protein